MAANVQTMMYVGETPWHKLGIQLDKEVSSAEAINAAGLNWIVNKKQLVLQEDPSVIIPSRFATVRADNNQVLGVVGGEYTVLQNADAFRFCDALVGEAAAMYHTAGALGNGEIIWILAKLPKTIKLKNDDDIENYLLFSHRHDGKQRVRVMFTPIRVVCQNTLNQAINNNKNTAFIKHTRTMGLKLQDTRDQLGILYKQIDVFEELSNKMAEKQIKVATLKDYLGKLNLATELLDGDSAEFIAKQTRRAETEETVTSLFEFGPGAMLKSAKGTVWGAYNAVTRFVDYDKDMRSDDRSKSLLFGGGALLKTRAWQEAINLLN